MPAARRNPDLAAADPAAPREERMSTVDEAWFQMDRPRSPMVVAAVLEFDGVADLPAFAAALTSRLLRHPRFRQKVVESAGHRAWVEDDGLNLAYHVRQRTLSEPASDAELQRAVAHELEQSLDRSLPLWRVVLYPRGGSRIAVLFRAHHAIADGISMMKMLLDLRDDAPPAKTAQGRPLRHGPLAGVIEGLDGLNAALEAVGDEIAEDLRHPRRIPQQLHAARGMVGAIARVLRLPDDNPPRLRHPLGGRRATAWVADLSLAAIRRIAKMQNVTLNDVFLTALTGAFREALLAAGAKVPERQNLRVSVPINLRAAGDDSAAGNQFGLVLVDLPVGLEGWAGRLDVIADRMSALKTSAEARAVLAALGTAGHLPPGIEQRLVELVGGKAAAVVSNLPGPRRALTLCGAPVRHIVFWPPQAGGLGVGVGLLSYAGRVSVGISADTALLPQPQLVVDAFCKELRTMLGRNPRVRRTHRSTEGEAHVTQEPPRRGAPAPESRPH